jgi:8-oxo-dGTP pyrophosphatase MutT (NUDIX family)
MHRQHILDLLDNYSTGFPDEAGYIARARRWIMSHEAIFERGHPIHVTASAWVLNPSRSHVFMVHHGKLHQWFQPGGHADGETDVLRVALREVNEESGLDSRHIRLLCDDIFDVDIHTVPTTDAAPAHSHIDIRFLVEMDDHVTVPGSHESHEVRWIPLREVAGMSRLRSTHRMLEKTRQLMNPARHRAVAQDACNGIFIV